MQYIVGYYDDCFIILTISGKDDRVKTYKKRRFCSENAQNVKREENKI